MSHDIRLGAWRVGTISQTQLKACQGVYQVSKMAKKYNLNLDRFKKFVFVNVFIFVLSVSSIVALCVVYRFETFESVNDYSPGDTVPHPFSSLWCKNVEICTPQDPDPSSELQISVHIFDINTRPPLSEHFQVIAGSAFILDDVTPNFEWSFYLYPGSSISLEAFVDDTCSEPNIIGMYIVYVTRGKNKVSSMYRVSGSTATNITYNVTEEDLYTLSLNASSIPCVYGHIFLYVNHTSYAVDNMTSCTVNISGSCSFPKSLPLHLTARTNFNDMVALISVLSRSYFFGDQYQVRFRCIRRIEAYVTIGILLCTCIIVPVNACACFCCHLVPCTKRENQLQTSNKRTRPPRAHVQETQPLCTDTPTSYSSITE